MADIRIKDLTTLESASLTGDVFVIDGTTGTRKLSAFSPTFGGNATVTGTLTVNGATLTSTGDISVAADKGIYLKQGNVHKWTSDGTSSGTSRADIYADSGGAFFIRTGGATQALTISSGQVATFAGAVAITSTASSTSTSSGALVVGNGTQGGLGVGGAINCGGLLYARGTGVNYFVADADTRLEVGNSITDQRAHVGIVQRLNLGNPIFSKNLQGQSGTDNYTTIGTTVSSGYSGVECGYGGLIRLLTGTGATTAGAVVTPTTSLLASTTQISIPLSTISTSTSSGALVVSGGLGVGGSINAGGNVTISGSNGYAVIGGRQWSFRANSSGGSPASGCVIRDDSAAADRLTINIDGMMQLSGSSNQDGLPTTAVFGGTKRVAIGYNTTGDYGFIASADSGTTWKELHLNPLGGLVKAGSAITAASTITSTASSDSGLLQLNLVNSSTGTSASSLFRFNAGTRTATLQAYNDTHATLAGQLRVGTSNGDIVLIPSGVAVANFSSANVTLSGDLLFFANSTYDIGTTANRVRQIFVRDIYSTFYTPASATDTGTAGRICYDSNYIYICTATNTWKRAAISTW